jgi:hypothetical protein
MNGKNDSATSSQDAYLGFDFFQPPAADAQGALSPATQRLIDIMSAPSAAEARAHRTPDLPKPLVYRDMGLLVYLRDMARFKPRVIATRPPRLTSTKLVLEARAALYTAIRSLPTGSLLWLFLESGVDDVRYSLLLEGTSGVSKVARFVHVPHHPGAAGASSVLLAIRTDQVLPQIQLPCFELLEDDDTKWHEPALSDEVIDGLLAASAPEDSLAADPFAGDGRLLCAARRAGLRAYGHETAPSLLARAASLGVRVGSLYSDDPPAEGSAEQ